MGSIVAVPGQASPSKEERAKFDTFDKHIRKFVRMGLNQSLPNQLKYNNPAAPFRDFEGQTFFYIDNLPEMLTGYNTSGAEYLKYFIDYATNHPKSHRPHRLAGVAVSVSHKAAEQVFVVP